MFIQTEKHETRKRAPFEMRIWKNANMRHLWLILALTKHIKNRNNKAIGFRSPYFHKGCPTFLPDWCTGATAAGDWARIIGHPVHTGIHMNPSQFSLPYEMQQVETRAPKGALKCNFPPFYEIMTDQPTDQPTVGWTWGLIGKLNCLSMQSQLIWRSKR